MQELTDYKTSSPCPLKKNPAEAGLNERSKISVCVDAKFASLRD